jgi:transglutaminase superfamily protein
VIHYDEVDRNYPGDWVVENGWYDCQLGSSLLAALCRARRIAARLVRGYLLYPKGPCWHYWAEFWDDSRGWVPVDTIAASLSVGGRDRRWRDYFFGQLDYRMKTECLPRLFTGNPTIRFPPVWHLRGRPLDAGVETGVFDTDSGAPIYRDQVRSERVNATPS